MGFWLPWNSCTKTELTTLSGTYRKTSNKDFLHGCHKIGGGLAPPLTSGRLPHIHQTRQTYGSFLNTDNKKIPYHQLLVETWTLQQYYLSTIEPPWNNSDFSSTESPNIFLGLLLSLSLLALNLRNVLSLAQKTHFSVFNFKPYSFIVAKKSARSVTCSSTIIDLTTISST